MTELLARTRTSGLVNKVPLITATFWVIKILSTTVGETSSDYLAVNVGLGPLVTDGIVFTALALVLTVQLTTRRYTPWVYWLTVVLISISGTQITDFLTDTLGVSLYVSTAVFSVLLAVVFVIWHRQERTLAITSINTRRRESFYWAAILVTFALGTAAGDLATEALSLGFRNGVLIFGGGFVAMLVAWRFGLWPVLGFWVAYVLTRPLGASIGDLLTQDRDFGGLGLGAILTSLLFFAAILVLVAREQVIVSTTGVADKDDAPRRTGEALWATAAAVAVVVCGAGLSITHNATAAAADSAAASNLPATTAQGDAAAPAPSAGAAPGTTGAAAALVRPTTRLGNLSAFTAIVADVDARARRGNLGSAKTRVKDLEVAWDDAEAGLKPRDPAHWNTLDHQIDDALTALRAGNPKQAECVTALDTLQNTLRRFDGQA